MTESPDDAGSRSLDFLADPMLAHFLSALDVRLTAISSEVKDADQAILIEIQKGLLNFPSLVPKGANWIVTHAAWNEAYRLERLLALIEPPENLLTELTRRTNEAVEEKIPCAPRLQDSLADAKKRLVDEAKPGKLKDGAEHVVRLLLLEALEEIHWTLQRKFHARPLQKSATSRAIFVGLITAGSLLAPYLFVYFLCDPPKDDAPFKPFSLFPLWSALTAGLFGAFFSRLIFLQQNAAGSSLGVLKDARDWSSILSRGFVGMCGALIVYFFLQAGLLAGSLFPDFEDLGLTANEWPRDKGKGFHWLLILPNRQLALLVVWSFLAGFSERLVPNVLTSTENTLNNALNKAK